jgi:hypothetical protein
MGLPHSAATWQRFAVKRFLNIFSAVSEKCTVEGGNFSEL